MVLIQLGVWGRILIIGVGGACIVLSIFVAACFLGPGCIGHKFLYKKQHEKKQKQSQSLPIAGDEFLLSDVGSAAVVTLYNINQSFKKTPVNCRTSVCSTISETSLTSSSNASYTSVGFMPLPTVTLVLQYIPSSPGKLIIFLRNVDGLPGKDFPHQTEVIVELKLTLCSKLCWSGISRAIRNTRSPEYNSEFSVAATLEELQKWCLTITVYDKDRFKGHRELATVELFVRDLGEQLFTGQVVPHASLMTHYCKEYGHLLLGLSFLPTAQRLTISLVKAANLHCLSDLELNKEFCPFARVFLLDGTGKVIQKKKTEELGNSECPRRCFFNSVLSLQVTSPQMLTATLLIILCYKPNTPIKTIDFGKDSCIEQISRDGIIGRVALGNLVGGNKERKHWQVMQERSRRVVTSWHTLR